MLFKIFLEYIYCYLKENKLISRIKLYNIFYTNNISKHTNHLKVGNVVVSLVN